MLTWKPENLKKYMKTWKIQGTTSHEPKSCRCKLRLSGFQVSMQVLGLSGFVWCSFVSGHHAGVQVFRSSCRSSGFQMFRFSDVHAFQLWNITINITYGSLAYTSPKATQKAQRKQIKLAQQSRRSAPANPVDSSRRRSLHHTLSLQHMLGKAQPAHPNTQTKRMKSNRLLQQCQHDKIKACICTNIDIEDWNPENPKAWKADIPEKLKLENSETWSLKTRKPEYLKTWKHENLHAPWKPENLNTWKLQNLTMSDVPPPVSP